MADYLRMALASIALRRKLRAAAVALVVGALSGTYLFALAQIAVA